MFDNPNIEIYENQVNYLFNNKYTFKGLTGHLLGNYKNKHIYLRFHNSKKLIFNIGFYTPDILTNLTVKSSKQDLLDYLYNQLENDYLLLKTQYKLAGKNFSL